MLLLTFLSNKSLQFTKKLSLKHQPGRSYSIFTKVKRVSSTRLRVRSIDPIPELEYIQ